MTEARIGASLADVEAAARVMGEAAGAAATAAGEAVKIGVWLRGEITEITKGLTTRFDTMKKALLDKAAAADTQLGSASWDGNSREQANQANADLRRAVSDTDSRSHEAVDQFKGMLDGQANEFDQFATEFSRIGTKFDEAYGKLDSAMKTFAQNLESADSTIRYNAGDIAHPGGGPIGAM